MRERRDDLIGVAAAEVGKVFTETDVEVSEAVDFLEFYPYSRRYFDKYENLEFKGKGVGVVVPPWNFPSCNCFRWSCCCISCWKYCHH